MPDRGDLGVCGVEGCEGEGTHTIVCQDCGGIFGYMCHKHADKLEAGLTHGGAINMRRHQERNSKED